MYYNTVSETGNKLKEYKAKASRQDWEVLKIFTNNAGREYTSHQVEDILEVYPRSSVVRSMNTLENEGLISKTARKVTGKYGRAVHTYRVANEVGQSSLF
jgi:predicted transcriptional regulator